MQHSYWAHLPKRSNSVPGINGSFVGGRVGVILAGGRGWNMLEDKLTPAACKNAKCLWNHG